MLPPPHRIVVTVRNAKFLVALALLAMTCSGCEMLQPRAIPHGNQQIAPELLSTGEPQIEVGKPRPVLDTIGKVVGIPGKLLLFDRRVDNHAVSQQTLGTLADYLHTNHLPHVKVRANQYAPIKEFQRLRKNKTVAWPYRYTLGLASVARSAIFPGRIFGGDHFNPYTQTINLYSDVPAIALHEGAHAKDFTRRKYQGTYALAYTVLPLWHETIASEDVFSYAEQRQDPELIAEANRILYPAYGTYVGGALGNVIPAQASPLYYGSVIAGHVNGRMLNRQRRDEFQVLAQRKSASKNESMIASSNTNQGVQETHNPVQQASAETEWATTEQPGTLQPAYAQQPTQLQLPSPQTSRQAPTP